MTYMTNIVKLNFLQMWNIFMWLETQMFSNGHVLIMHDLLHSLVFAMNNGHHFICHYLNKLNLKSDVNFSIKNNYVF
jgi:hypothetical protein